MIWRTVAMQRPVSAPIVLRRKEKTGRQVIDLEDTALFGQLCCLFRFTKGNQLDSASTNSQTVLWKL